jgi:hypothetical protein
MNEARFPRLKPMATTQARVVNLSGETPEHLLRGAPRGEHVECYVTSWEQEPVLAFAPNRKPTHYEPDGSDRRSITASSVVMKSSICARPGLLLVTQAGTA